MAKLSVELVHFSGCPHVDTARGRLRGALEQAGLATEWTEWDAESEATPARYRSCPSPTVLVDGRDVSGVAGPAGGISCSASGAPTTRQILTALRSTGAS